MSSKSNDLTKKKRSASTAGLSESTQKSKHLRKDSTEQSSTQQSNEKQPITDVLGLFDTPITGEKVDESDDNVKKGAGNGKSGDSSQEVDESNDSQSDDSSESESESSSESDDDTVIAERLLAEKKAKRAVRKQLRRGRIPKQRKRYGKVRAALHKEDFADKSFVDVIEALTGQLEPESVEDPDQTFAAHSHIAYVGRKGFKLDKFVQLAIGMVGNVDLMLNKQINLDSSTTTKNWLKLNNFNAEFNGCPILLVICLFNKHLEWLTSGRLGLSNRKKKVAAILVNLCTVEVAKNFMFHSLPTQLNVLNEIGRAIWKNPNFESLLKEVEKAIDRGTRGKNMLDGFVQTSTSKFSSKSTKRKKKKKKAFVKAGLCRFFQTESCNKTEDECIFKHLCNKCYGAHAECKCTK